MAIHIGKRGRWLLGAIFTLSCIAIATHAFGLLFEPVRPGDPFAARFATEGLAAPAHFFLAGLALLVAPLQLSGRLRRRWPALHRQIGWLYVASILIGGISALPMAIKAGGGISARVSFVILALVWLATTATGIRYAIARDFVRHRRWMTRSISLTYAAVTLRVILGVGVLLLHLPFSPVYTASAWLAWLINLGVCELWLRRARFRPAAKWRPRRPAVGGNGSVSGRVRA